jgi:hypothetical protein
MSVNVIFVSIYGENRRSNSICETRYEPLRSKREKPIKLLGLHHKLLPVEKTSSAETVDNWNYKPVANYKMYSGPVSDRKTKAIFYICTSHLCLIQCPCVICRGESMNEVASVESFEDHRKYHHCPHTSCTFCSQLLEAFPAFSYSRSISLGPFYAPKYRDEKTFYFSHSYEYGPESMFLLQCESCDKKFKKISHKKRHFLQEHYEARFSCNLCSKRFPRKDTLMCHIDEVHEVTKISCDKCDSKFSNKRNLMRHHKKFHVEIMLPQFVCEMCGDSFFTKIQMQKHMKKDHKQFECSLCSSKFSTKFNLRLHNQTSLPCTSCDKTFCTNRQLSDHEKSFHGARSQLTCESCNTTFSAKFGLEKHYKNMNECWCEQCQLKCCNERAKIKHIYAIHKAKKCDICGTDRRSLEYLNEHISKEHLKSDHANKLSDFDENIDPKALNVDCKGLYTVYFETDAKYPAVFKEFNQHAEGGSPSIFSGREENSFLVSFTESAALLRAIRGSKDSLKLINVRIVSK